MTTARDIITSALRKIQVLGTGSSLDANEADEALDTLNAMLASFSAEGYQTYQNFNETFTFTTSKESYTIGSGQDFDTAAPIEITAAYVTQSTIDYPLTAYGEQEYSRINQKNLKSSTPDIFYYDDNHPVANIYFYPVPTSGTTFTMYSRKPLTSFDTLDTVFSFPAEYEAMLVYNLAVWIAPEYEREASPTVRTVAAKTKKTVAVQNRRSENRVSSLSGIPSRAPTGSSLTDFLGGRYYT